MPTYIHHTLRGILKKNWGYDAFRDSQLPIIESIVSKQDTFAILPTGGGKSICFQVPALYFEGLTLVISPLIALMIDQIEHLQSKGISAEALHSGLDKEVQNNILSQARSGHLKLLYVSPERLLSKSFNKALLDFSLSLLVVDEAHCISQYGFDFRPSYRRIAKVKELFPEVPVMAVTATATKKVVQDIKENLLMQEPNSFIQSSRRTNIAYKVYDTEDKRGVLLRYILALENETGIIYARNRKLVALISDFLKKRGVSVAYFHAGISSASKQMVQRNWIDGKTKVVVATNAFGMGIDKSNVRYVIHYDLPPTIEDYTQEAGRAGRDGQHSEAIILHGKEDLEKKYIEIEKSYPTNAYIQKVYKCLSSYVSLGVGDIMKEALHFNLMAFCNTFHLQILGTYHAMKVLDRANLIHISDAFYNPSLLQINRALFESSDQLSLNKNAQLLLKTIVRIYDGIFYKKVKIDEAYIAKKSDIDQPEVIRILSSLSASDYLEYVPKSDAPKIKFLGPRLISSNIKIPDSILVDRKKDALTRLNSVQSYLQKKSCRQVFMDSYFDNQDTEPCGMCDNCQKDKKAGSVDQEFTIQKIKELLRNEPKKIQELFKHFGAEEQSNLILVLQYMEEENFVTIVNDTIILKR